MFKAKFEGKKEVALKLLREATAGFVAITDVPGNCLIPELQELYPNAEVIVVNRDKHDWFKSIGVVKDAVPPWLPYFLAPMPGRRWFPHLISCFYTAEVYVLLRLLLPRYYVPLTKILVTLNAFPQF